HEGSSTDDAAEHAMFKGREFAAHPRLAGQVDVGDGDALPRGKDVQNGSPAVHDHAVAVCLAAIGMLTHLRGYHKVTQVFDSARAYQQVPVGLAGGHGEGGRYDEELRAHL